MNKASPARSKSSREKQREVLYHLQAEICRVLGHPRRLAILDLLAEGETSTARLLRQLRVSKVNLSQHLALMRRAGLVSSRQEGRKAFHRLAFPEVADACRLTRDVLHLRLLGLQQLTGALHPAGSKA